MYLRVSLYSVAAPKIALDYIRDVGVAGSNPVTPTKIQILK